MARILIRSTLEANREYGDEGHDDAYDVDSKPDIPCSSVGTWTSCRETALLDNQGVLDEVVL